MDKETNYSDNDQSTLLQEIGIQNINHYSIIDTIINEYGYSYNTWKIFFVVFFILISEGIHLTYFGNLLIPIKNFYSISDNELSVHSTIIFFSLILGALSSGYVSKIYKRYMVIIISQVILSVLHVCLGMTQNIIIFSIMRLFIGFLFGITIPMCLNILTEYLPIYNRAYIMVLVWLGFGLGQCIWPFLMLLIMPNMETDKYPNIIIISSIFSFVSLLYSTFFLKDSPRNLIITGYIDEGIEILAKLKKQPIKYEEKTKILRQINTGINSSLNSSLNELFNNEYLKYSILLTFIQLINSLTGYGLFLIFSLTMKELGIDQETNYNQIIINQFYINAINLLSNIFGGLLCENSYLGRIKSMILCAFCGILLLILTTVFNNYFEFLFGFYGAVYGIVPNITTTYVSELYPTKIRDMSLGYIISCGRVGAIISQLIFLHLHNSGIWVPYYTTIGILLIQIILLGLLPIETFNKPLDTKTNFNQKDAEIKN